MRILLDAKDLISIVEHEQPVSREEFANYLQKHDSQLVLSFANVSEFVAPLASPRDFLRMRRLLQDIQTLPVCYIREPPIPIEELRSALKAFDAGREFDPIDPYVQGWDETFHYPGPSAAQMFVNYRLDEIVFTLWSNKPDIFRRPPGQTDRLRAVFAADRKLPRSVRKSLRKNFANTVRRHLALWSVSPPKASLNAFSDWIYSDPFRCPGLRLNYETFHELLANLGDVPRDSDIPDFGYINAIPYVEAATLDRRIFHYCNTVSRKLCKLNSTVNYTDYIFPGVQALLEAIP